MRRPTGISCGKSPLNAAVNHPTNVIATLDTVNAEKFIKVIQRDKSSTKREITVHSDSRINHDGDPNAYTKKEAVASCWRCYVPTVIVV